MNSSVSRILRLNLVRNVTEYNLKLYYRNSDVISKYGVNITNFVCVSPKDEKLMLVRHGYCTLVDTGVSLNDQNLRKCLDNIVKKYKKYIVEKTGSQKQLFETTGIVGLLENKIKLEENLKSLEELGKYFSLEIHKRY